MLPNWSTGFHLVTVGLPRRLCCTSETILLRQNLLSWFCLNILIYVTKWSVSDKIRCELAEMACSIPLLSDI